MREETHTYTGERGMRIDITNTIIELRNSGTGDVIHQEITHRDIRLTGPFSPEAEQAVARWNRGQHTDAYRLDLSSLFREMGHPRDKAGARGRPSGQTGTWGPTVITPSGGISN